MRTTNNRTRTKRKKGSVDQEKRTNTGGQEPSTTEGRDPNIPENIEVTEQGDQMANQGAQMIDPTNQQGQPAVAAQGV
jgi:hypothetical protein